MAAGDEGASGETVLQALPLVAASEPAVVARPRFRFAVPRIFDYLLVASVIYFLI